MSTEPSLQVWAVFYHPDLFSEELYQRALKVIDNLDSEASARIRRFYRREDACRTLIGHLLRRLLLLEKGVDPNAMKFSVTEAGKPYIVSPNLEPPLGFNITHDNALVAMAFSSRSQNPPAFSVGIDVMKLRVPGKESFPSFVRTVGDQIPQDRMIHNLRFRVGTTGEIDVQVERFTVLNSASTLPFTPSNPFNLPSDDLRARYRYLDLRRTVLSDNIKKRSQVAHLIRNTLHDQGMLFNFLEVETPVLLRSSPEGAREFLVPTRVSVANAHSNSHAPERPLFYALQQSPQQPKQLLICSGGVDRYFQLAKCFRDEDGRKDRQPEFTQIDLEMAYVSWGQSSPAPPGFSEKWRIGGAEVRQVVESLIRKIWLQMEGITIPDQFRVMTYREAMTRYGSDKPDTRFGLEITNITPHLTPDILSQYEKNEEVLECIIVRKSTDSEFIRASKACRDNLDTCHINFSQSTAETWLKESGLRCEALQGLTSDGQTQMNTTLKLRYGDDIWLAKRSALPKGGSTSLGRLRLRLSELAQSRGDFTITTDPHFLWITEFPLFTRADEDKDFLAKGRWSSSHHPFTAPMWQDIEAMYRGDIELVRGQHYDLVLNGVEIGGGSVRVHDAAMQDYIFGSVLQLTGQEKAPFDQLLHALKCGAPPHGGIALGFDRLMAILCNTQSIRDVIAFPKTSTGTDLLFRSPATISEEALSQYGLRSQTDSNTNDA
ncbi:Aspartate--tRNA ligase, mitochondrial [Leucoagaricus sp. SymC.cos]|nr:Aspartate--tRNA ligase, mitochondrial [Leucoagaricus sp. SymC.cos]